MPMQTTMLVSVEAYLSSSYQPDRDYVDGVLEERNWGEWSHSRLQLALARYLGIRERRWNVWVLIEQRVRIGPRRFRVPDVCVFLRGQQIEQIPTKPPLVCLEILSPEDRWTRVERRIEDFLTMGVEGSGYLIRKSGRSLSALGADAARSWRTCSKRHRFRFGFPK
jgi:Uma2 family endonuclease